MHESTESKSTQPRVLLIIVKFNGGKYTGLVKSALAGFSGVGGSAE